MTAYECPLNKYQQAVSVLVALNVKLPGVKLKVKKHKPKLLVRVGPAKGKTRIIQGAILYLAQEKPKLPVLNVVVLYPSEFLKRQDDKQYQDVQGLLAKNLDCTVAVKRFSSFAEAKEHITPDTILFIDETDYKVLN